MKDYKLLIKKAIKISKMAYAPYSKFHVGAALLGKNGEIYTGCNIENASFGATNCAERTAFFKAVSKGCKEFEAIAIVGSSFESTDNTENDSVKKQTKKLLKFSEYAYPCGICRQVMLEFCDENFKIIVAKSTEEYKEYTLGQLMPFGFGNRL